MGRKGLDLYFITLCQSALLLFFYSLDTIFCFLITPRLMTGETPPVIAIVKKNPINSVRGSPILDWTEQVDANQKADQAEPARGGIP